MFAQYTKEIKISWWFFSVVTPTIVSSVAGSAYACAGDGWVGLCALIAMLFSQSGIGAILGTINGRIFWNSRHAGYIAGLSAVFIIWLASGIIDNLSKMDSTMLLLFLLLPFGFYFIPYEIFNLLSSWATKRHFNKTQHPQEPKPQ